MRHFAQEILNFLQNLWDGGIFGPQRGRGRARPARRSARPPFNGQLPLTPRAGHARPLPRGCHRLPRRGQDPSLRTIVHGCFVGSGLDRSAGWAGVGELGRRGGIHAARDICGGGNSAGRIYAAPTNRSEKWRLRLICRGGIHAAPTHCPQTVFCMAGRRGHRPLPPHFVCAQCKLHLFYYLLSFISYLFIICSIRGMIYLTPISITKRSDPF